MLPAERPFWAAISATLDFHPRTYFRYLDDV